MQLLRKYIGYARTYVAPRLSEEAGEVLRAFYLDLRRQSAVADGLPVTARPGFSPCLHMHRQRVELTSARLSLSYNKQQAGVTHAAVLSIRLGLDGALNFNLTLTLTEILTLTLGPVPEPTSTHMVLSSC